MSQPAARASSINSRSVWLAKPTTRPSTAATASRAPGRVRSTTTTSAPSDAARYPTEVLRAAGVEPVERDEMQERLFPQDVYDVAPATFADVDPALAEPGLAWSAAKAWTHRRRHGAGLP